MSNRLPSGWDRKYCRRVINQLRDGLPPPAEAIEYLSIGTEPYLQRAREGMAKAASGLFDSTILVGPYGIGKSHLLRRVHVMAEAEGFIVRSLEIGHSRVYFNDPEEIARRIAGEALRDDLPPKKLYYTDRKFVDQLNFIASSIKGAPWRSKGLVILLDEMENSFSEFNLPRLPSRIKAYRYLNTLFCGESRDDWYQQFLGSIYVMIAITPGVIENAMLEAPGYLFQDRWVENPAIHWRKGGLPDQIEIVPLTYQQAMDLMKRIREIHTKAFDWNAAEYVGSRELVRIAQSWQFDGVNRDERELVKTIISQLETSEQAR